MRSLADVAKESEEDSDEDEGNEYYAGGEKRSVAANQTHAQSPVPAQSDMFLLHDCSGQVVKGAPKNKVGGFAEGTFGRALLQYICDTACS